MNRPLILRPEADEDMTKGDEMTTTVEALKSQLVALSGLERADLAYYLLSTLQPDEEGAEEAWRVEIARRVAEIKNGTAKGRSADDVLAELRERHP